MTIILDETYRLENGQLIKKIINHTPCTKKEVINYYKDKTPLAFKSDTGFYLLSNDKVNVISNSCYGTIKPIDLLFIEQIYIIGDRSLTQVWSRSLEIEFPRDEYNCIDYKDGYILQGGFLMKVEQRDWFCTDKETTAFFKKVFKDFQVL